MKKIFIFVFLILYSIICHGCVLGHYFKDRGLDLLDIPRIEIGGGAGFNAGFIRIAITKYVDITPLIIDICKKNEFAKVGIIGREVGGWLEYENGIISLVKRSRASNFIPERGTHGYIGETNVNLVSGRYIPAKNVFARVPLFGNIRHVYKASDSGHFIWEEDAWRPAEIGFEFTFLLGIKVGISFDEIVDFIIGWTTIDIKKDDSLSNYLINKKDEDKK